MAIASSYLKDRALDWWYSIQESVEYFGQFEDLFKKKFMKVIYEKAWKELKTVQQRPDEDVEGSSNRLRQLFRAAGVTDEGTKKAIFVASVLPGIGYEMKKVLSNRKRITFEDLVDEATEHELLLVKYDRKKVDMYGLQKKSVAFEVDNSVNSISKDTMSEVSSINSVFSDLVNEMRALKSSTVELQE
jgi:predicted component of type VI protein secretion system